MRNHCKQTGIFILFSLAIGMAAGCQADSDDGNAPDAIADASIVDATVDARPSGPPICTEDDISQCPRGFDYCNYGECCGAEHYCAACLRDEDCPGWRPFCGWHACHYCEEDADCPAEKPFCFGGRYHDPTRYCNECKGDEDCPPERRYCNRRLQDPAVDEGTCVTTEW